MWQPPARVVNPGLFEDCLILYGAREWLAGSSSLDWDAGTSISGWPGIVVSGNTERVWRVQRLSMGDSGLDGTIPATLGGLSRLTHIYLQDNDLTGVIPQELGGLQGLEVLRLDGNRLTGNIPAGLGNLKRLRQLLLDNNQLRGNIPPELGDLESLTTLWLRDNSLGGEVPVRLARLDVDYLYLSGNDFIGCMPHGLRDVPYNDLDQYPNPGWFSECPNEAPVFAEDSYSFTIGEGAAIGDVAGSVAAEDPEGRTVAYAITAGNEDGKFGIGGDSGELSVAGELDYETETSYSLTVQATDGNGASEEITVDIEVAEESTTVENTLPAKPQNLTATLNDDGSVTLSWDATDDVSITGYQVLRRRPTEGEDTLLVYVEDTGSATASYTDNDVTAGVRHVYRVKAINGAGVGPQSNFVRVDP